MIDAAGKTLMPGLVMVHEHLDTGAPRDRMTNYSDQYVPQVMLAYGTTTARTAGSFDMEGDLFLKRWIDAGRLPGPDLDVSVYINGPFELRMLSPVNDKAGARREIAYWNEHGATSVKLFFDTTPEIARAAIDEGHRRGMNVAAHLCATFAATGARLGVDTIEHSTISMYDLVPGSTEGECDLVPRQVAMFKSNAGMDPQGPEVGTVLKALLDNHVAITPTLGISEERCRPKSAPPPRELALLAKFDAENVGICPDGLTPEIGDRSARFQAAVAVRFLRMGGTLLAGTDVGAVPGAMGPRELELLVAAGMTAREALLAATRDGAIKLRRAKNVGTLEVGKRADFLLVDGKPDQSISDIRKLRAVAKDGIVYDPEKLYEDARGKLD
ncbi:amidohydrolase family protein [Sphingomonas sabuli]|uniref:Amidohydrolase family protein n=1 Tax=Sphingomonas sabuli TaxID=2764186 RepID=A0A7G9L2Q5_9SPHN|nr:amidohydrolase family protein [Sphingomonas sabuli]QNM82904.1 amidohydrolase family protein [Sphingomonas sabuli]